MVRASASRVPAGASLGSRVLIVRSNSVLVGVDLVVAKTESVCALHLSADLIAQ